MQEKQVLWKDRKRTLFGLPWSFTKYRLTEEKLYVCTGLLNTREEEIRLYRILDVTLTRTLGEKMFGLGTLHICAADKSTPEMNILRIKQSRKIHEMLSDLVEAQRNAKGVIGREFLDDAGHFDGMM